jgi:hypothetical protein
VGPSPFEPEVAEMLGDETGGAMLLEGELGVAVQVAVQGIEIRHPLSLK